MYDEAYTAVETWLRWRQGPGSVWVFKWVETPFVCATRRVGMTPDAYAVRFDGCRAGFDWKTGKHLHVENTYQGAAYTEGMEENGWPCDEFHVVHCPRIGNGPYSLVMAGKPLETARTVFAKLRWCYEAERQLKAFNATLLKRG